MILRIFERLFRPDVPSPDKGTEKYLKEYPETDEIRSLIKAVETKIVEHFEDDAKKTDFFRQFSQSKSYIIRESGCGYFMNPVFSESEKGFIQESHLSGPEFELKEHKFGSLIFLMMA